MGQGQQVQFCTTQDGVRIAYTISGEGPPLLFLPNWLSHLEYSWKNLGWRPWLEHLTSRYTLIRYDSRGCGMSSWDVRDITLEGWVQDVQAVVRATGIERFAMLGVCQGAPVAIEYAATHPSQVERMVLYGAFARGRFRRTPQQTEIAKAALAALEVGWAREDHAFLQVFATQFQPEGTMDHVRSWGELQRVSANPTNALRLAQAAFDADVQASARRIRCPALVVHPDGDLSVPIEEGKLLAALIPGARFVQLETKNHMPLPEEPAWRKFLDELERFVPTGARGAPIGVFDHLSGRELEILDLMASGRDNAQIAATLDLSEKTVRNTVTRVFDKLGVENRPQAIILARENGLGRTGPKAKA